MTPQERQRVAYAPELAVLYALCAAAEATCAALAAAQPLETEQPHSRDYLLATRLYAAIVTLQRSADAYRDHIADCEQRQLDELNDDFPF